MQGNFCFIKSPIFAFLPDIDMRATCWIFDEACSCGPYVVLQYMIFARSPSSLLFFHDGRIVSQNVVARLWFIQMCQQQTRFLSFFLILWSVFWGLFSLYWVAWRIRNTNFRITFRYLKMYVSTQKLPQIFLYMSTTCCESFKSFGEIGKKFFY